MSEDFFARNTFEGGLSMDMDKDVQKNNTMAMASGIRILNRDNSTFVATNLKGNEFVSAIKAGYEIVAIKERNGVAYIFSAEVVGGVSTGRGEIGSFPSPKYPTSEGELEFTYKALKNYAGDNGQFPGKNGDFNSIEFNFSIEDFVDIELQDDYDGTVNIIFSNNGKNPLRIINSGFTVLADRRYKIVDRQGEKDTNRYIRENFKNSINLISSSDKIMKCEYLGTGGGGSLKAGNYRYYFKLATADGNETEVLAQSLNCSVFFGDKISNIRGGKGNGEDTNKQNRFRITNVDQAYSYLSVYFVHAAGLDELVNNAFHIDVNFNIIGETVEFSHTGYEDITRIDINELSNSSARFGNPKTITQINGYLMAAGFKGTSYEREPIREFINSIALGHKEELLDVIGNEDNLSRMASEAVNQGSKYGNGTTGWNGAYWNPMNIYYKTGYFGGETYPFAAQLVLKDGTLSDPFPVHGVDNIANDQVLVNPEKSYIDQMLSADGFDVNSSKIKNVKGIYRFPSRRKSEAGKLIKDGKIVINGVTFKIPEIPQDIKDRSIGIVFLRAERKPDLLAQGYLIDTMLIPSIDYIEADASDKKLWDYNGQNYTEDNSMVIPVYDYLLEGAKRYNSLNDGTRSNVGDVGIHPVKYNVNNRNLSFHYQKKFAFLSNDAFCRPSKFAAVLNNRDIQIAILGKVVSKYAAPTNTLHSNGLNSYFSLIQTKDFEAMNMDYNAKSSWVSGGSRFPNADRFSGGANFQAKIGVSYAVHMIQYNDYAGIYLPNNTIALGTPSSADEAGGGIAETMVGNTSKAAVLVNIYENGGQRTSDQVKAIDGNIDSNIYFPISDKMTWEELENSLDSNRRITCFGGDCFVNIGIRRIFKNEFVYKFEEPGDLDESNIGYSISICNESVHNVALRNPEQEDLSEREERTFFPFDINNFNGVGDHKGTGNDWRDNRLFETKGYNNGYSKLNGDKQEIVVPSNLPFIQNNFFSRIAYSGKHVPNSFLNAFRSWVGLNWQDYDTEYGEIVKIANDRGRLTVIFEHGVAVVGVEERIQTGGDSSGPIFVESSGVLSPKARMLSTKHGSKYPNSIKSTDNALYGYDAIGGRIWFTQDDSLFFPSKYSIESHLKKHAKVYADSKGRSGVRNVVASWDKSNDEVLFTFYNKSFSGPENFTVAFSEDTKKINSFYPFLIGNSFRIGDSFYSVPAAGGKGIYKHDSENVSRMEFYKQQYSSKIAFVVNEHVEIEKIFSNLALVSNNVLPSVVRYYIQGGNTEQNIVYDSVNIHLSNAKYRDGKSLITIPPVKNITNEDATRYFSTEKDNALAVFRQKTRFRDRSILIELEYDTPKQLRLTSALTKYLIP